MNIMNIKLGDLGVINTGNTPSMKIEEFYSSNDIPFIKPDSFGDMFRLNPSCFLASVAEEKARIVESGAILVTCIGTIGKVAITNAKIAFNQQINSISVNNNFDSEYIAYNILFNKFRLQSLSNSAVVPIINKSDFSKFEIKVEHNLEKQIKIKKRLNKVNQLKLLKEDQIRYLDLLIKSRFVDLFGDIIVNSKTWPVVKLKDIASYRIGLTYKPEDICMDGVPVFRSGNIQNSALVEENLVYVKKEVPENLLLKRNDILMCARNGSKNLVGKVALINISENYKTTYGAFMMGIRSEFYAYLIEYFKSPAFRRSVTAGETTTINQITTRMLNSISLPLPDKSLIIQFEDYCNQTNKLKSDVQKSIDETQLLMDSLMQEYFG